MTKVHAKIRISGSESGPKFCGNAIEYYWSVVVLGVECSKPMVAYKTEAVAERTARKWCHRVGFDCTVTVDKDARS